MRAVTPTADTTELGPCRTEADAQSNASPLHRPVLHDKRVLGLHMVMRHGPPGSATPLALGDFAAGRAVLLAAAGAFLQPMAWRPGGAGVGIGGHVAVAMAV